MTVPVKESSLPEMLLPLFVNTIFFTGSDGNIMDPPSEAGIVMSRVVSEALVNT